MSIILDGTTGITTPDLIDSSLTSGRVVYAGTSGNLTGSDNLTFSGTSLTLKTGYYEAYDPTDSTSAGVGMRFYTNGGGTKVENGRLTVAQSGTGSALSSMIFQTNNGTTLAEKMRLTGAGSLCVGSTSAGDAGTVNVSIGSPATTAGGLQLWATSAQEHYIQWGDSATGSATYAGAISYAHATDFMRFWTDSTERMRLNSTGLGIGTSSPSSYASKTLQVNGSSTDVTIKLTNTTTGTGNASGYDLEMNGNDINYVNRTASGNQKFWTNSTERARIDSSGNLLVGTTSTSGSVSNTAAILGGVHKSFSGSVSAATNTYTTLFTVPTAYGSYIATVFLAAADVNNYQSVVIISTQPSSATKVTTLVSSGLLAFQMSGYSLQATQNSGGSNTIYYEVIRIGS